MLKRNLLCLVLCPIVYFTDPERAEIPDPPAGHHPFLLPLSAAHTGFTCITPSKGPATASVTRIFPPKAAASVIRITPAEGSGTYVRTEDGLIVYPDPFLSGNTGSVKLQVVSDNIIRVLAGPDPGSLSGPVTGSGTTTGSGPATGSSPGKISALDSQKSLITVYATDPAIKWDIANDENTVILTTRLLHATVTLATGAVTFTDRSGSPILSEKTTGGRSFEPAVFDGEAAYHIRQTFTTRPGEALYGLGQHQDGLVNYKGRQTRLFQNNSEVAVPFLLSNNNYGILWDNYSLSTVGDIRPYKPLSAMRLFSKTGEQGWLTASYRNDKDQPGQLLLEKAGSDINYTYLGDSKRLLPEEFKPGKGSLTWEGALASEFTGEHQFHCTYGGYIKIWIDGKLLLDRWRQAWNPGSAILDVHMEKDKQYPVKIEWIPDGDESYCSLNWLDPIAPAQRDDFSFSSEAGKRLDYYFIYGANSDEVIAGFRYLTGKSTIVPQWAMGLWQSRERYKTQDEILNTVKEFRARKIPLDNIVLDWSYWQQDAWGSQEFDARRFPSPDSMIRVLHQDYHTHFMISVWPKFYQGIPAYRQFDRQNWLYKRNIADNQRDWIGKGYVSTFYDAFSKEARKGFWDLLQDKLYSKGIDAWWMDASEPDILSNVSPEKRKEQMTPTALGAAAEYLNAYPLQNARGIYEGQRSVNPDQRVFILTRSAFAGSQHYGAAVWSGDIAARWSDMKTQIAAGISFSLSGIPYWSMDIGGFAVEHRFEHAQGEELEEWREQMTRWYQFGAFCPLFRVHGQFPYREIYNVAPDDHPAYKSMLYYDRLRYRLLPYIYSLAGMTWQKDYTIMRGLVMDFGKDTAVDNIGDEYMLGPSLLVSPVTGYHQRSREVYLPAAQGWYDLYTGKYETGGRHITADAPYERVPVFVKEGSILPFGPALQYTGEKPADPITVWVYTGKDASFTLYEDEDTNYHYEKGQFVNILFSYNEATRTLTINKREGAFPHMRKERTFRIIQVSRNSPVPLNFDAQADKTVFYKGERKVIKLQ